MCHVRGHKRKSIFRFRQLAPLLHVGHGNPTSDTVPFGASIRVLNTRQSSALPLWKSPGTTNQDKPKSKIGAANLTPHVGYPYLSRYRMSWFKTLEKTDKRSQHPPPLNIVSHADAGPSSISAGLNPRVRPGGALPSAKQIGLWSHRRGRCKRRELFYDYDTRGGRNSFEQRKDVNA